MSKARTLASTVSTGAVLADGTVAAAEVTGLATVATSGAYSDVSGTPTLPTFPSGTIVGDTDAQTLTNKTVTNIILDGSVTEEVFAFSGTALNPANGTVQTITLTGNTTFTDSLTTGQSMIFGIDDGTAYTVTWPTITWTTNPVAAPTLPTSGYLWVVLWKVGSTLYGKY